MDLKGIIETVSDRLGNRRGLDPRIIRELELVQSTFEKSGEDLPWFLAVDDETLAVPATQSKALPTGFLRMKHVFKGSTFYTEVNRDDLKPTDSAGCTIYAIQGDILYLPDSDTKAVNLEITYWKADVVLADSNSTNGWTDNFPSLLISLVGIPIAKFTRDLEAVQLFKEDLQLHTFKYQKEVVAREESARFRTHNRDA